MEIIDCKINLFIRCTTHGNDIKHKNANGKYHCMYFMEPAEDGRDDPQGEFAIEVWGIIKE